MSDREITVFSGFLECSDHYVEFGTGGSTALASALVGTSVLSVDSSQQWIAKVAETCAAANMKVTPELNFVDIGPVGDWGRPLDVSRRDDWPNYHGTDLAEPEGGQC